MVYRIVPQVWGLVPLGHVNFPPILQVLEVGYTTMIGALLANAKEGLKTGI